MKRTAAVAAVLAAFAVSAQAGPEKIKYPSDYLKHELYDVLDRPDVKQQRYLYATPAAVEAARKGKPVPSGTVLTLVQWSVEQDANGNPLKGPDGRFIKKDRIGVTVMEKRTGWGAEYGPEKRNGEWEYAAFTTAGEPNPKANANIDACFKCHLPHQKIDYVISLSKLEGKFPSAEAAAKAKPAKSDVNIVSFAFMPAKIEATAGKPLTFVNSDPSPHQITVQGGPATAVMLRGQRASLTLDKAGGYNYICGLHPSMKGTIEVK